NTSCSRRSPAGRRARPTVSGCSGSRSPSISAGTSSISAGRGAPPGWIRTRRGSETRRPSRDTWAEGLGSTLANAAAGHRDTLRAEAPCVFALVAGHQPPVRGDHPPPWQPFADREDRAHGAGGSRVAGLLGHFAVGGHLPPAK